MPEVFSEIPSSRTLKLSWKGCRLQNKFHEPKIYIYLAQAYAELFPAAFESMHRLNNLFGNSNAPINNDQLPLAPFFNAAHLYF